jgi:hypothetical protein
MSYSGSAEEKVLVRIHCCLLQLALNSVQGLEPVKCCLSVLREFVNRKE